MKTVSTKLDNILHNQFLEICNNEKKCQSEFLREMIKNVCENKEIDQSLEAVPQDLEITIEDVKPTVELIVD